MKVFIETSQTPFDGSMAWLAFGYYGDLKIWCETRFIRAISLKDLSNSLNKKHREVQNINK